RVRQSPNQWRLPSHGNRRHAVLRQHRSRPPALPAPHLRTRREKSDNRHRARHRQTLARRKNTPASPSRPERLGTLIMESELQADPNARVRIDTDTLPMSGPGAGIPVRVDISLPKIPGYQVASHLGGGGMGDVYR